MLKIFTLMKNELSMWVEAIVSSIPGIIGIKIRAIYCKCIMSIGDNPSIAQGCHIKNARAIKIGNNFVAGSGCKIYADQNGRIEIGNDVGLNTNVMINADLGGTILIGSQVMIGPNVVIRASNHVFNNREIPMYFQGHQASTIEIADDVWIAANVVILPGVKIGKGAIVAAGAVVTKNIDPYMIVGGIPAAVIKERNT